MIKENNYSSILNKKLLNFKLSKLNSDMDNLKRAYPNYSDQTLVSGQYNIDKWIETLREIYHKEHSGATFKQALDLSTESWNPIEKNDFTNWIRFYQSGNHLKYKTAQDKNWYENEDMPGYFIPVTRAANDSINKDLHSNIDFANDSSKSSEDQKIDLEKSKSEAHRKKLISRLDSLEKLLRNYEDLPGEELTSLMEAIFSLKKKIINLKKRSSVESFCKDLIIRQANTLANKGSYKAASFLYVVAEEKAEPSSQITPASTPAPSGTPDASKPTTPESTPASPSPAPPPVPTANVGSPASAPTSPVGSQGSSPGAPVAAQPSTSAPTSPGAESVSTSGMSAPGGVTPVSDPLKELEKDLGTGGLNIDVNKTDDLLVFDEEDYNNLNDILVVDDGLFSIAQDATDPSVAAPPAAATPSDVPKPAEKETITTKNFDDQLESLLGQVTIEDVVLKIEEICKVFKTREIPRQLAVVDMMLDRLGLASFFPSLSEATNKSLESNNYILSRIENILAQLRGAIKTKDLDLTHESVTPAASSQIKKNLEEREKAEQERKQIRKELEDQALLERAKEKEAPTPELEVTEEELAPEAAPAAPVAPAPAPTAPTPPTV